ncbi:MAG: hypothetical protein K6G40_00270 [Eubacterium sp.]|nr:hypothetical protein [Eubacterium sp.]
MKRRISILLAAVMLLCMISGCGNKFDPDENAVYIKKDGSVIAYSVEEFNESYYDEVELTDYINEQIDTFTAENEGEIKLQKFSVDEEGYARMVIKYDSVETYSSFNGVVLYAGSVASAIAEGYDFDIDFSAIDNGESADASSASGDTSGDSVKDMLDSNCVITGEDILVKVAGSVSYVSATGSKAVAKDQVRASSESGLTYIIYN